MIILVSGRPGGGKTLWTVAEIARKLPEWTAAGRKVYSDIRGLNLPGVLDLSDAFNGVDPVTAARRWSELPDGSVIVFDEVQRAFPTRNGMSTRPDYIADWQTHRHRGIDAYFITQAPRLIDRDLWPLIDQHVHLYRPLGLSRSSVWRWEGLNENPEPTQNRSSAFNETFKFPKHLFGAYHSATEHFVKPRMPWKILIVLVLGIVFAFGGAVTFYRDFTNNQFTQKSGPAVQNAGLNGCVFAIGSTPYSRPGKTCF